MFIFFLLDFTDICFKTKIGSDPPENRIRNQTFQNPDKTPGSGVVWCKGCYSIHITYIIAYHVLLDVKYTNIYTTIWLNFFLLELMLISEYSCNCIIFCYMSNIQIYTITLYVTVSIELQLETKWYVKTMYIRVYVTVSFYILLNNRHTNVLKTIPINLHSVCHSKWHINIYI